MTRFRLIAATAALSLIAAGHATIAAAARYNARF
jgi:hypothetical protein